jgi:hypothetical protein
MLPTAPATAPPAPLAIMGDGYTLTISQTAEELKQTLLKQARAVTTVLDNDECNLARERMKGLAAFRQILEKSRKAVQEPVAALVKSINAKAADFGAEVNREEQRLSTLITTYAAEQERLRREAAEKLRQEAMAAERKRMEEERARLAAERAALEAERAELAAKTKKQREAAAAIAAEARKKEEEARAAAAAAEDAQFEQEQAQALALQTTPAPIGVKPVLDFEVIDAVAFYRAFPLLCEVHVKRRETLAFLKARQDEGIAANIPGLRITEKFNISTR